MGFHICEVIVKMQPPSAFLSPPGDSLTSERSTSESEARRSICAACRGYAVDKLAESWTSSHPFLIYVLFLDSLRGSLLLLMPAS